MKYKILLVVVVLLAFFLRFYQLGETPVALNIDEVAIGYNAYSILQTGKDEFGKVLTVVFRSYDDFKPPLLIYLTVLPVALLGLTDFAVRLAPAILGVGSVLGVYFLSRELFGKKIGLTAAFLLSISPWHLGLTRAAFEVGAQSFFSVWGLYFFLLWIRSKKVANLILSAAIFSISIYLYQASKVFAPFFVFGLFIIYFRQLLKDKIGMVLFAAIAIVIQIPNILAFNQGGLSRFQGTSVFQNGEAKDQNLSFQTTDWLNRDRISAAVFHPTVLEHSQEILTGYLSHFRPDFLFLGRSGAYNNYFPQFGLMYLWEAPFLLAGLYFLFSLNKKTAALVLVFGVLLSPLPAAMTYGVPNPIRSGIILPFPQIITGVGIVGILTWLRKNKGRGLAAIGAGSLIIIVSYGLLFFQHQVYWHDRKDNSKSWYFGYRQAAEDANLLSKNYSHVVVSTALGQPHEFFLYYLKYNPVTYQTVDGGTVSGGYSEDKNHFGKFIFRPIKWEQDKNLPSTLFVGQPTEFAPEAKFLSKVNYLDGKPAMYLVGNK